MSLGQYGFSKFESLKLLMDCIVEQTECEGRLHSNLFITKPLDIKSQESSMICFDVFNLNLYRLTHLNFSFLPSFKTHRFNYLRSTYGWSGLPPFYCLWSDGKETKDVVVLIRVKRAPRFHSTEQCVEPFTSNCRIGGWMEGWRDPVRVHPPVRPRTYGDK